MAPQRYASAPLPPILLVPRKIGGALRPLSFCTMCAPATQIPTPPPARARPPSPFALGRSGRGRPDSSLPPPTPGGGLNTMRIRSAKIPIPTPAPRSLRSLPPSRSRRGAYITFAIPHKTIMPCLPPITPPTQPPLYSALATAGRSRRGLRLMPAHARPECIGYRTNIRKVSRNSC